ncbi:MAG: hypothetical protein IJE52_02610 [Bacteroidales bacterium]|nr:hypothetical protein [Bacteroidales bacterium]
MKKKIFSGMIAAAGLLLTTSCSNDNLDVVKTGDEVKVTFSLAADSGIATRAISDGKSADMLYYAIYNGEKKLITTISPSTNGLFTKSGAFPNGSKKDEVTITLTKGQEYTAVFWAQDSECNAYTVTAEPDGLKVAVNYEGDNNDETRDAFFKAETFNVTGNAKIDVELKRPFAQINVGVTEADWNAAVAAGINISESKVVIKNAATSINLLTGEVSDETTAVTYDFATIPAKNNEVLAVDANNDGTIGEDENYKYLSMSYILTDNDAGKTTLEPDGLQFTFRPASGVDIVFDQGLQSVPVQRNWRTNILGKILTGDIQFNIVIDEIYDNNSNLLVLEEVANGVKIDPETGTYYINSAAGLQWLSTETGTNNNQFTGYTVKLSSDIDMTNADWTPIGTNTPFKGTFDGNGKTISNISKQDFNGEYTQTVGLFASVEDATVKNLKIENMVAAKYGAEASAIAAIATGDCTFEGIDIINSHIVTYNNDAAAIVGWANIGNFTFKDITVGDNVVIHSLWNSYDTTLGGIIGTLENGSTVNMENVNVSCMLDAYNDVCSNYQWGAYRRSGMLIGNLKQTQNINGTNYPNPAAAGVTCNNVTVTYGDWMNYHYCEFKSNGHGSYDDENTWKCSRVEGSDWGTDTIDTTQCNHESFESHNMLMAFDQLFGGGQGVYGLKVYNGVTVNYPESYTSGE